MKKSILFILLSTVIISCGTSKKNIVNESKYYTDSIYSNSLTEYRKHNIYLPRGFRSTKSYPIFYATDGNKINKSSSIQTTLDSLINNKIIKPIVFIESYNNNKIADSTSQTNGYGKKVKYQYRNFEYVKTPTTDSLLVQRFDNHMNYFKNEMIPYVEKQLNQKNNRSNRYFYGFSNGAGFGMSLLNKYPDIIGTYLCFSTFGGDIQTNNWNKNIQYPNLYLNYETEEPFFLKNDADFIKKVYIDSNSFSEINQFKGGHNYKIWKVELIKLLIKLFSTEK